MVPILFIVVMLIIISYIDAPLVLLILGLLFIPIALVFAVNVGNYDNMFTMSLGTLKGSRIYTYMLQGIMFTLPAMAFIRMIYINRGYDEAI